MAYDPNSYSFNTPQTDDNTSAPPEPEFTHSNPYLQKILATVKQRKQRTPASLARAIAWAKRAKPARSNG